MELFKINPQEVVDNLLRFLREGLNSTGRAGFVIGLSGGLDSAVCTALGVKAIGAAKVRAVLLPYSTSSKSSLEDAQSFAEEIGIETDVVEISPMADAYLYGQESMTNIRKGNLSARLRMAVLYDKAAQYRSLVLGTSNKTEALLGYGTINGDAAWDINPIWDLYKTHVRELAKYLKIPATILKKVPTADLWEGQTDEGELGFSYDRVDRLLFLMIDCGYSEKQLTEEGFNSDEIERARKFVKINQFKRTGPMKARLFDQYPGCDFVAPDDWA